MNYRNNNYRKKELFEKIEATIQNGLNIKIEEQRELFKFNGYLDEFAKELKITTNQVRKIFNEIKKIDRKFKDNNDEEELKKSLIILYPKISYNEKRDLFPKEFAKFISLLIEKVLDSKNVKKDFNMFINIIEGFVGFVKNK